MSRQLLPSQSVKPPPRAQAQPPPPPSSPPSSVKGMTMADVRKGMHAARQGYKAHSPDTPIYLAGPLHKGVPFTVFAHGMNLTYHHRRQMKGASKKKTARPAGVSKPQRSKHPRRRRTKSTAQSEPQGERPNEEVQ